MIDTIYSYFDLKSSLKLPKWEAIRQSWVIKIKGYNIVLLHILSSTSKNVSHDSIAKDLKNHYMYYQYHL